MKRLLLAMLLLTLPALAQFGTDKSGPTPAGGGGPNVAFIVGGNQGTNACDNTSVTSPASTTCTTTTQTNAALIGICIDHVTAGTVTNLTMTWNSVSMTQVGFNFDTTSATAFAMFSLANPAIGTTLAGVCTATGGTVDTMYVTVAEYSGADQTHPVRTSSYTTFIGAAVANSYQASVPSASGDMITSVTSSTISAISACTGTSCVIYENNQGGSSQMLGDNVPAVGSTTIDKWTIGGATDRAVLGALAVCKAGSGC